MFSLRQGNVECTITADINKDGFPDIVPNTPGAPLDIFMLNRDKNGKGTGSFSSFVSPRRRAMVSVVVISMAMDT